MSNENSSLTIRIATSGVAAAMSEVKALASTIKSLAAPIAGAISFAGITAELASVVSMGAELERLHDITGASVKSLTTLDLAFQHIGGSAEGAQMLITKMQRSISEAVAPIKGTNPESYARMFAPLGLDPKQLIGLSADQQLLKIGVALNAVTNDAQRADIAMQIFGRSGAQMLALFRNADAMRLLQQGSGTFGDVMQRNALTDERLQAQFRMIPYYFKEATAGILDQLPVADFSAKLQGMFDSVDWTKTGQRFGALVTVIIDSFKDNKFPEMLGLLVEAGFELGEAGVKKTWLALWSGLTGETAGQIDTALFSAIMSFGVGSAKFLINVLTEPIIYMAAGFDWLYDEVRVGFEKVGDGIKNVFADSINYFVNLWNKTLGGKFGKSIEPIANADPSKILPGKSFEQSLSQMQSFGTPFFTGVNKWLEDQLQASKNILGVNQSLSKNDNVRADALTRLNALIDEQLKKTGSRQSDGAGGTMAGGIPVPIQSTKDLLLAQEVVLKNQLIDLNTRIAAIEGDYTKTTAEKYKEKLALLTQEKDILGGIIAQNDALVRAPGTSDTDKQLLMQRNATYGSQLGGVNDKISKLGPDPTSFFEQYAAKFTKLQDQLGTLAQQTSTFLAAPFESLNKGIDSAFDNLMMKGGSFKTFMRDLGTSMYQSFSASLSKMVADFITSNLMMVVRWIATQVEILAFGRTMQAASTVGAAGIAASLAAVWYAPAVLSAIASAGTTAALAPAEVGAALLAGFAEGGFTGSGGRYDVAGVVHRGEYVMPAYTVSRLGVGTMDAIRGGSQSGAAGGAATGPNQTNVQIATFGGEADAKRWADSQQGEVWFLNMMNRHASRYSGRG